MAPGGTPLAVSCVGQPPRARQSEGERCAVAEAADQHMRLAPRRRRRRAAARLVEGQDRRAGHGKPAARAAALGGVCGVGGATVGGGGVDGDGRQIQAGNVGQRRRRAGQHQPGERRGRGGGNAGRRVGDLGRDLRLRIGGFRRRRGRHIGEIRVGQVHSPAGVAASGQSRHLRCYGTNQRDPNNRPKTMSANPMPHPDADRPSLSSP